MEKARENKELSQEYYDKFFNVVANSGFNGLMFNLTHRMLERNCPTSEKILEVGAGEGQHIRFVRKSYTSYIASDFNPKYVTTQNDDPRVEFRTVDVSSMNFPDGEFDRIISTCLLHHVIDVEAALEEMRRTTKKGGRVSIYLSCDPGVFNRLMRRLVIIPKAKKNGFLFYELLIAREHRNHFLGIDVLLQSDFIDSKITRRFYPFKLHSWNFNLFVIYQITV